MKQQIESEGKDSRRKFLNNGALAGASIALGVLAGNLVKDDGSDKVKMMTADGHLVEVDRKHLPSSKAKAVSNKALKEWMDAERK